MKVTLKKIQSIVSFAKKQSRPILENAMVFKNTLTVTDLETYLVINDVNLSDGLYHIKSLDNGIKTGDQLDEFPSHAQSDYLYQVETSLDELLELIKHASKDSSRIVLNSITWHDGHLCACDGYTALRYKKQEINKDLLIPSNSVNILIKLLKAYKIKNITIKYCNDFAYVNTEYFKLSMRLIQREYPKLRTVYTVKKLGEFRIDNWINFKDIKSSLNQKTFAVKIELKNGTVTLITDHASFIIGSCNDDISLLVGFNMSLLDRAVKNGSVIKYNNNNAPFFIDENAVVMPLKI